MKLEKEAHEVSLSDFGRLRHRTGRRTWDVPVWDLKIEALVPLPWRQRKRIASLMAIGIQTVVQAGKNRVLVIFV